jgi:hypothetical protein
MKKIIIYKSSVRDRTLCCFAVAASVRPQINDLSHNWLSPKCLTIWLVMKHYCFKPKYEIRCTISSCKMLFGHIEKYKFQSATIFTPFCNAPLIWGLWSQKFKFEIERETKSQMFQSPMCASMCALRGRDIYNKVHVKYASYYSNKFLGTSKEEEISRFLNFAKSCQMFSLIVEIQKVRQKGSWGSNGKTILCHMTMCLLRITLNKQ